MTSDVIAARRDRAYRRGMTDLAQRGEFGSVLRDWRIRRRRSQLALATEAGVSQRHISCLETGRANPSREMVVHLGLVLDVPLRDRNAMLNAAGFAPVYAERSLDDPDLVDVRQALETVVQAHDPFPAYIVDRRWNIVFANAAAGRLIGRLPAATRELAANVLRLVCHPDGLRLVSPEWRAGASVMLRRLQSEATANPNDDDVASLLGEMLTYPDVSDLLTMSTVPHRNDFVIPLTMTVDDRRLAFITTITALMGPVDVTLEELRLETLLPADAETGDALRAMADG